MGCLPGSAHDLTSDAVITTIEAAIERNAAMRADLLAAIRELPDERRLEVWYGEWSVKDVLVHLAAWQDSIAEGLELIARGERPQLPGYEGDDDAFNARNTARAASQTWEQVLASLGAARERHEAAARGLAGQVTPDRLEEGKTAHRFLFHSGGHDEEHIPDILEWRRTEGR